MPITIRVPKVDNKSTKSKNKVIIYDFSTKRRITPKKYKVISYLSIYKGNFKKIVTVYKMILKNSHSFKKFKN